MVFCNKALMEELCAEKDSHNPYFNRWFSAINKHQLVKYIKHSHNPYFNRWFSAIMMDKYLENLNGLSQSLF